MMLLHNDNAINGGSGSVLYTISIHIHHNSFSCRIVVHHVSTLSLKFRKLASVCAIAMFLCGQDS